MSHFKPLRLTISAVICMLGVGISASTAQAAPVHIPIGHYTVDIAATSTIYTSVLGSNGGQVNFGGFHFSAPSASGVFDATFTADAGYVFDWGAINLAEYTFCNCSGSYQGFDVSWFVSDSTYTGPASFIGPRGYGDIASVPGGTQGQFHYYNPWAWSSGTGTGLAYRFIPVDNVLDFPGVQSFSVHLTESAWGGAGAWADTSIWVLAAAVPGFPAPIPEPETYAMLLAGSGLLGLAARRRKQKEAA